MTREAERKRLVELICNQTCNYNSCENSLDCLHCKFVSLCDEEAEDLANALLDNGIVVPPCKVGDKVYYTCGIHNKLVKEARVEEIYYNGDAFAYQVCSDYAHFTLQYYETYFTREEAEKTLEGNGE